MDAQVLRKAIDQEYYFELVVDDLPLFAFVGEKEEMSVGHGGTDANNAYGEVEYFVLTHLNFEFHYNENFQIVDANVTTDERYRYELVESSQGPETTFTYSVKWLPSDKAHSHRVDKFSMVGHRNQHPQIHWISIVNSCMLVVLLIGILGLILLRILRNDISKVLEFDDDEEGQGSHGEDCGWKKISGDVFRPPADKMLLSSLLGTGSHILVAVFAMIGLSAIGFFSDPHARGATHNNFIRLFALTACVAGFVSAYGFKKLSGDQERKWVWCVILAGCLFSVPLFGVAMFNNSVALAKGTTQALPFSTMMQVFLSWLLICMPITLLGGILGRRMSSPLDPPCRTTKVPREIPRGSMLRNQAVQMFISGFLPFSAIYIELHYLFASIWGFKLYTLFGMLLLIFCILLLVTSFLTVALMYFQLTAEDHHWWWRSFFTGAAPGLFVYGYCFIYFFRRSEMSGFHQGSFFFGYMAMACYGELFDLIVFDCWLQLSR